MKPTEDNPFKMTNRTIWVDSEGRWMSRTELPTNSVLSGMLEVDAIALVKKHDPEKLKQFWPNKR